MVHSKNGQAILRAERAVVQRAIEALPVIRRMMTNARLAPQELCLLAYETARLLVASERAKKKGKPRR